MSIQVGIACYRSWLVDLELDICYMWMLIQENLMEKARIGITLLLEEEPTEDNIFVTGYTQEWVEKLSTSFYMMPCPPAKKTRWSLCSGRNGCATSGRTSRGTLSPSWRRNVPPSSIWDGSPWVLNPDHKDFWNINFQENLPKDESQLSKEEEELKKENDEIAAKLGKRNIKEEIKKKVPSLSKERQLNDGTFVPLDKKFWFPNLSCKVEIG